MNAAEERALRAISSRLNWIATREHAWNPPPFHVEGLHPAAETLIEDGIADAHAQTVGSPIGVVIQGEAGAGKTHLLSWVTGAVRRRGGYFFLVDFSAGEEFWRLVAASMVQDLGKSLSGQGGETQAVTVLRRLGEHAGIGDLVEKAVSDGCTRNLLDGLMDGLIARDRQLHAHRDTVRALVLYALGTGTAIDVGYDHLTSSDEAVDGSRTAWGMSRKVLTPREIVIELSAVLALTGPSVIAVDQIDALLDAAPRAQSAEQPVVAPPDPIKEIARGLMDLKQVTRRTLCLVACLPSSWRVITRDAVGTAQDRFQTSLILGTIGTPEIARSLVERRLTGALDGTDATLPAPLWLVAPEAFATAKGLTPRTVLRRLNEHITKCRVAGVVRLLDRFDLAEAASPKPAPVLESPGQNLDRLDVRFAELRDAADIGPVFDHEDEDETVPALLAAGLDAWIRERGEDGEVFSRDPLPGRRPPLHARLRQSADAGSEEERHWTFRMIGAPHHIAALKRLSDGMAESGSGRPDRSFIVLRNHAWSDGATTQNRLSALRESGGRSMPVRGDDFRVFAALRTMADDDDDDPDLDTWLRSRRPAHGTELFADVLGGIPDTPPAPVGAPPLRAAPPAPVPMAPGRIRVGRRTDTGTDLELGLETLTRHTAVFAGSGSGKSVLLRRLVEECALQGVSSILLDLNNDLARLGDRWPKLPAGWSGDDADRAERYFAETEVVVWTPGRSKGRPLSFQPLPDFSTVLDDRDELDSALGLAVAALAPRAKFTGASAKAQKGQAVLRQAMEHFARCGGRELSAFIELLSDLPLDVAGQIDKADELAAEAAQLLTAARINDKLFAGDGDPVDPALLLTPSEGKRARVSVISFIGLDDDARPGFVSRLQMALFSWIKKNPARDRPLSGLYVMDEAQAFAPAVSKTDALTSTLTLASQARKYGLGLVFATQMPKGLHNQIAGNATTQFIGRTNSSTQLDVVKNLAQARGGNAARAARLEPGEFYVYSNGLSEALIRTPLCLSYHPSGPLTEPEILSRATR